jgi:hypothetical protein
LGGRRGGKEIFVGGGRGGGRKETEFPVALPALRLDAGRADGFDGPKLLHAGRAVLKLEIVR